MGRKLIYKKGNKRFPRKIIKILILMQVNRLTNKLTISIPKYFIIVINIITII